MSEIRVSRSSIQPGDKIISVQAWDNTVTVDREGPNADKIYSRHAPGGTVLYMDNGRRFWHAYKIVESIGKEWGEFATINNIESVDSLRVVGNRVEE